MYPVFDLKRRFAGLVAQQALRGQGARPAAEQGKQMQSLFRNAPSPDFCGGFVHRIRNKRRDARGEIQARDGDWQPPGVRRRDHEKKKTAGQKQKHAVQTKRNRPVLDKGDRQGLGPALGVMAQFVRHGFILFGFPSPIPEGRDVQKNILSAIPGSDEAEPPVIIPSDYLAIMAHGYEPRFQSVGKPDARPHAQPTQHFPKPSRLNALLAFCLLADNTCVTQEEKRNRGRSSEMATNCALDGPASCLTLFPSP